MASVFFAGTTGMSPPPPPAAPPPIPALLSSAACKTWDLETDALLLVDPQNCFMETRSVRAGVTPRYPLDLPGERPVLASGPLAVTGSSEIIDVMNAWIDFVGSGHVYTTLDWHPAGHCSFCQTGSIPTTNASVSLPDGGFCLRGAFSFEHFDGEHRCRDAISEDDYLNHRYYQWPVHCVAGSTGARLDPYLRIPDHSTVIKLGVDLMADAYSAFDDGRTSIAPSGTHDTQAEPNSLLSDVTLQASLYNMGVQRIFAMGLATDYVVGRTVEAALDSASSIGLPNVTVALVQAGTRGIFESTSQPVIDEVNRHPWGQSLVAETPVAAMAEHCAGTCDLDSSYVAQCHADLSATQQASRDVLHSFCARIPGRSWGECTKCPMDGCRHSDGTVRGNCVQRSFDAPGRCECYVMYEGDGCQFGIGPAGFNLVVISATSVLLLLCILACVACVVIRGLLRPRRAIRRLHSGKQIELSLAPTHTYHIFLSHTWATGQDQVNLIKRRLQTLLPGHGPKSQVQVFLDVEDLDDVSRLEDHVAASAVVCLFISNGYFLSKNCLREVKAALAFHKPMLLVAETDPNHGGAPIPQLMAECPDELRASVFDGQPIVPWLRISAFQLESLRLISEQGVPMVGRRSLSRQILMNSPKYLARKSAEHGHHHDMRLFLPGSNTNYRVKLHRQQVLWVSANNPGAVEVAAQIVASPLLCGEYALGTTMVKPGAVERAEERLVEGSRVEFVREAGKIVRKAGSNIQKYLAYPLARQGSGGVGPPRSPRSASRNSRKNRFGAGQSFPTSARASLSSHSPPASHVEASASCSAAAAAPSCAPVTPTEQSWQPVTPTEQSCQSSAGQSSAGRRTGGHSSGSFDLGTGSRLFEGSSTTSTPVTADGLKWRVLDAAPPDSRELHSDVLAAALLAKMQKHVQLSEAAGGLAGVPLPPAETLEFCEEEWLALGVGVGVRADVHVRAGDAFLQPVVAASWMLVVLNRDTFVGEAGEALASEVLAAIECGLPLLTVHESGDSPRGCLFERLLTVTPREVQRAGLYKKIAIAWHEGRHNLVSCAMLFRELGCVEEKSKKVTHGQSDAPVLGKVKRRSSILAVISPALAKAASAEPEETEMPRKLGGARLQSLSIQAPPGSASNRAEPADCAEPAELSRRLSREDEDALERLSELQAKDDSRRKSLNSASTLRRLSSGDGDGDGDGDGEANAPSGSAAEEKELEVTVEL